MNGPYNKQALLSSIQSWLVEDMPYGDITSQNIEQTENDVVAHLVAKASGILCGAEVFSLVFQEVDPSILVKWHIVDGSTVEPTTTLATISGPLKSILMAERLALNLMQRMSGIATLSSRYADAVKGSSVRVVDTRKTTPGLRQLEKYAVRTGGCYNHRYSLSDAVMIKDNHIKAAGSITNAVTSIRYNVPHTTKIEVEVETIEGLKEALKNHVDIIMLDNMDNTLLETCVTITEGRAILEASGNMTIERLPSVAQTGVDIISVGALTHSVSALDISLKFA